MYVFGVGQKFDMEHGSSRCHCVLPTHRTRLGAVWFSADISAALRVVFVEVAIVVDDLPFEVEHCQTGLFLSKLSFSIN